MCYGIFIVPAQKIKESNFYLLVWNYSNVDN